MRWIERALLLIGVLALGSYAYATLDARLYESRESRRLAEARQQAPPAGETDALGAFHPEAAATPLPEGDLIGRVEIPRIGVSTLVLEGIGTRTLRRGAGHIPGTPLPEHNRGGNVGIAAHRDSFFRGLKDIRKNDIITLETLSGTHRYQVEWTEIVMPEDTHVLEPTSEPALTLVTCYPFYYVGSAPKRFIVRAVRIGEALEPGGVEGVE